MMLRSCFLSSFVEFRSANQSGFRGEVVEKSGKSKMSQPIRGQERPSYFSDLPKKHKLGRGHLDLASCQVSLNSDQQFQRRSRKCLSQSEPRTAISFFRSGLKNTNLVEDVEILLPVKYCWILFSGVSEEKSKMWKVNDRRTDGRGVLRVRQ